MLAAAAVVAAYAASWSYRRDPLMPAQAEAVDIDVGQADAPASGARVGAQDADALGPASLCEHQEQVIFSCAVRGGRKYVSVCGSEPLDHRRGYLQYRFGRRGAVELEFPASRQNTQRAFRYDHYFRAQVDRSELAFERGGYEYVVYHDYEADAGPVIEEAGVRVTPVEPRGARGGGEVVIGCDRPATNRLSLLESVVLARVLMRLGRPQDAVLALRPALHGKLDASNFYVTHTELHEALAHAWAAAGQRDSAVAHYACVARLGARRSAIPRGRKRRGHGLRQPAGVLPAPPRRLRKGRP